MAAANLNTIRSAIEGRLATELASSPVIPVVYHNMPYTPTPASSWVQCLTTFGENNYLSQGGTSDSGNLIIGVVAFNIFTPLGVGSGDNLVIGKRIRDLYNRIKVSGVYFDPPNGPSIIPDASPDGYFQSQLNITFEVIEEL
tara:strand:+ start:560 stop:985 length:426 start_codon:yes stop_codon:yes gene_type:complete